MLLKAAKALNDGPAQLVPTQGAVAIQVELGKFLPCQYTSMYCLAASTLRDPVIS